jgi:hypothetical protein
VINAKNILEGYEALKKYKAKSESAEPNKEMQEALKWLRENNWSLDKDKKLEAVKIMEKMCESDDADAQNFMEYMDDACSNYKTSKKDDKEEPSDEEDSEEISDSSNAKYKHKTSHDS